jgi:hypothetical protein
MVLVLDELVELDGLLEIEACNHVLNRELAELHLEPDLLNDLRVLPCSLQDVLLRLSTCAHL